MNVIWALCFIILALLAGEPMYLGIKLFLYGDYGAGSLTLVSGIIMALYFVWSIYVFDKNNLKNRIQYVKTVLKEARLIEIGTISRTKQIKTANEVWKSKTREMMFGIFMMSLIAVNRILAVFRFSHYSKILVWIGITMLFVLLVESYLLIMFSKNRSAEIAFRNKVIEKGVDWKYMKYATWNEASVLIMEETIKQCLYGYYAKGMVSMLSYALYIQCLLNFSGNKAIFALGTVIIWWISTRMIRKKIEESRGVVYFILNSYK